MFRSLLFSLWHNYQGYIEKAIQPPSDPPVEDIIYWQKRLFINAIIYALPASLLALVPSVIIEYNSGHLFMAWFNVAALATVMAVALSGKISLHLRRVLVAVIIALFAIVLTTLLGEFTMGCIYLFSLSVFICLQFSDQAAYSVVSFNVIICLCLGLVIRYRLFDVPLIHNTTFDHWIIYSLNFLFMDLVVVILIRQILNGLTRTMKKERWLFKELQKEMAQKASLHTHLKTSEEDYRTLFFQSPSPKLIFDIHTLQFLQVNKAAVENYGYSEEEFLSMKLTDIHSKEHIAAMLDHVHQPGQADNLVPYTTQHLHKDGKRIHTEIRRSNITYKGIQARMIITTDITQNVAHIAAIEQQNLKLKEIAYLQSHVIRLPLARIMSISELIKLDNNEGTRQQLLNYLDTSVKELDKVIREIVDQSTG